MKPVWLLKAVGTAMVTALLVRPWVVNGGDGVIERLRSFGVVPALFCVACFFGGVALYCVSLERCVRAVHPERRAMKPAHVWLMYVPCFNIVEDFFIIDGVTRSLEAEAKVNPLLAEVRSFGRVTGWGWCAGQVLSLWPSTVGEVASVVSLVLWVAHWLTIHRLTSRLSLSATLTSEGKSFRSP